MDCEYFQMIYLKNNNYFVFTDSDHNEKISFLNSPQKPVSLTPSWESRKITNDELNFKGKYSNYTVVLG